MRIIISPTRQMRLDTDSFACKELPVFVDRAEVLMKSFNWSGYRFDKNRSSEAEYVFIRTEVPGRSGGCYLNWRR